MGGLKNVNSAIISDDGSFREIFVSDRRKTPSSIDFTNIILDGNIKLNYNPIIEQLMSPLPMVDVVLPSEILCSKVKVTKILFQKGDPTILEDGIKYQTLLDTLNNTDDVAFNVIEYDSDVYNPNTRYHGSFEVMTNGKDLYSESKALSHCVFSYVNWCKLGNCSIYSMQEIIDDGFFSCITIEVDDNEIVQACGAHNRTLNHLEVVALKGWSKSMNFLFEPDLFEISDEIF